MTERTKEKKNRRWIGLVIFLMIVVLIVIAFQNCDKIIDYIITSPNHRIEIEYFQPVSPQGISDDIEIVEYTKIDDSLWFYSSGFEMETDHKYAEAFIDNKSYLSRWYYDKNKLHFAIGKSDIPKNKPFDITIAFYNEEGENIESIVIKGICYVTTDLYRVDEPEKVRRIIYVGDDTLYLGQLDEFINLEKLKIWSYNFSGNIENLAGLKNLRYLDIYGADEVYGDFSKLSGLENLEYLFIRRKIEGMEIEGSDFENYKNLKHFELYNYDGYFIDDTEFLSMLTSLEYLEIGLKYDDAESIENISQIPNLKTLLLKIDAGNIDAENIYPIAAMDNLDDFTMKLDTEAFCDLSVFSDMKNIESLSIISNSYYESLTGDLSDLSDLTNLKSLFISGNNYVTGDLEDLSALTNLESLRLYGGDKITGDIESLFALKELDTLSLNNFINITSTKEWDGMLENLEHLELYSCENLNVDIAEIATLPSLKEFVSYGCSQLHGDIKHFAQMKSIECVIIYWSENIYGDISLLENHDTLRHIVLKYFYNEHGKQSFCEQADPYGVYELWEKYF